VKPAEDPIRVEPERYYSINELAELTGISKGTLSSRICGQKDTLIEKDYLTMLRRRGKSGYALKGEALREILPPHIRGRVVLETIIDEEETARQSAAPTAEIPIENPIKIDPDRYYDAKRLSELLGVSAKYVAKTFIYANKETLVENGALRLLSSKGHGSYAVKGAHVPGIVSQVLRDRIVLETIVDEDESPKSPAAPRPAAPHSTGRQQPARQAPPAPTPTHSPSRFAQAPTRQAMISDELYAQPWYTFIDATRALQAGTKGDHREIVDALQQAEKDTRYRSGIKHHSVTNSPAFSNAVLKGLHSTLAARYAKKET
jgi:hypothetical protein